MDYAKAQAKLATARRPNQGKPLENNTRLVPAENGAIAVKLHDTNVVTFHPDGSVTLNSGGWRTVTTKERMNEYASPIRVWSDRGTWYARYGESTFLYEDGITFHADGSVTGAGSDDGRKEEEKLRKHVSKFASKFIDKLFMNEIDEPGMGDCLYCSLREKSTGKPLGEATHDRSHILLHIEEGYFVPSLLARAVEDSAPAYKQTAYALMMHKPELAFSTNRGDFVAKQIQTHLRKYMLRQLGMAA